MSLVSKDATSVGSLCERANSDGTRDFAGDTDLQAPFRNVKSNWTTRSLRTADAFPVVGREATTGNASAVRRLDHSYFTSQVVCSI